MKIITAMYTLKKGGAYDRFMMMMEAFLERKCEVHCLSVTPIQINHPYYRNHVVGFLFRIRQNLVTKLIVLFLFPLYSLLIGWREKINLYVSFSLLYAFIQAIPKWILKRPMVTLIRGDFTFGLQMQGSLKYFIWLNKVIEYIGLIASDRIITVNKAIQGNIMRVIRKRKDIDVGILFNNIPSLNNPTAEEVFKIRTQYAIPNEGKILVTAGILTRGKNIEILLKCLPKIRIDNLFFLVIGDGSTKADYRYQNYLKGLIETLGLDKKALFTGWLRKEELCRAFHSACLFVLPSLNEGMPNAMLEALGCDLPCIGSKIPGIEDILQYEELMFDPLDEEAVSNKIGRFFSDIQYSNHIKGLCQERKKAFVFDWKEKVFQMATKGIIDKS